MRMAAHKKDTESDKLLSEEEEDDKKPLLSVWRQRLLVFSILATICSALCTDTFLYPFFPLKAKGKGLTDTQIGLVFSSFDFARFVSSLIAGYLAGKMNSKIICLTGSMLTAVCSIAFGFTTYIPDTAFFSLCVIIRMLAGAGTGALAVSGLSVLMKSTSYKINTLASLGEMVQALGPIGGTALGAGLYELVGYTSVFGIMGGLMLLMNIIQMFTLPKLDIEPAPKRNAFHLFKISGIFLMFLNVFTVKFETGIRVTGLSQYMVNTFNKSPSFIALMFTSWSALYTISIPVANKILNKGFIFSSMMVAWLVTIILVLLIGPSPLLDFIFHGKRSFLMTDLLILSTHILKPILYTAPYQASINLAVVNGYEQDSMHTYGMITGLINSGLALGSMAGPIVGGVVTEMLDFTWSLTVGAIAQTMLFVAMAIYLIYMRLTNQPLAPEERKEKLEEGSSDTDDCDNE